MFNPLVLTANTIKSSSNSPERDGVYPVRLQWTVNQTSNQTWRIKMLYDGQCPLCSREVAILRRRNRLGKIAFEDIAAPGFDPSRYGLTLAQAVGAMHAVRPDGSLLKGMTCSRSYTKSSAGRGWRGRCDGHSRAPLAELGYRLFAAIRPRLSGFRPGDCSGGTCATRPT